MLQLESPLREHRLAVNRRYLSDTHTPILIYTRGPDHARLLNRGS